MVNNSKGSFGRGHRAYDEADGLTSKHHVSERRDLAARRDSSPEVLMILAADHEPEVRRALAGNRSAPGKANLILAEDIDVEVRVGVAEKIALLAPQLSSGARDQLRRETFKALEILARDQVVRVRQALADAFKDEPAAPPGIVRQLARDVEILVSGPVLQYSPVLTDQDLLDIINEGGAQGTLPKGALNAIAKRAEVHEQVSDALVNSGDSDVVTDLLGNRDAQIREETLDSIIDRASGIAAWHDPLVRRPKLPPEAAQRLASFVADNLLRQLANRRDLPAETIARVMAVFDEKLGKAGARTHAAGGSQARPQTPPQARAGPRPFPEGDPRKILDAVRVMQSGGYLEEDDILRAVEDKNTSLVQAALAVRAEVPLKAVVKVFETHSAKGVVALCWKARLSMAAARRIQIATARLAPRDVLRAERNGAYPMTKSQMMWQISFFTDLVV